MAWKFPLAWKRKLDAGNAALHRSLDRFVSPGTPVTAFQHELLDILKEECAEVAGRASKATRFGLDETQPGQPDDNAARLGEEIGDVLVMIELVKRHCGVTDASIQVGLERKPRQLRKYMQHIPEGLEL
ncbi:hypothetical protein [Thalassospira xiamenensis]|uniref:NTP pyrophosphohydrolase MazG putative catalytic core domain-containing protein n=1 Tax=Thalassospira xiamenensis TaxID=220697 RepID=A0ABR5XWH1_9PROT|nr:hypothetical protein [Thalassospira xiamenensis]KZC97196.1 hypothetical protein AUP40_04465 [Thalassospira xiamenensis]KZD10211.1 hypothetical protein AUP45_02745 [Thalassospira xiamenensis]MCD1593141.1 hypothetical protein [Thalassospira xiamenensis]